MNPNEHNNKKQNPSETIIEKDVLGLDRNSVASNSSKAKPNRIFIVLAIVVVIALVYWLVTKQEF